MTTLTTFALTDGYAFVPGVPVPQGSTSSFRHRSTGRVITTGDNKKTKPWRADIQACVRKVLGPNVAYPRPVGVLLHMEFVMPRRAAEPKRSTPAHTRKPDTDKLVRAVFDALTGLVYEDDSQVVRFAAIKRTAEIGEQTGVHLIWCSVIEPAPAGGSISAQSRPAGATKHEGTKDV